MQNLNTTKVRKEINQLANRLFGKDLKELQETQQSLVVRYYVEKKMNQTHQRKEVK